MLLNQLFSTAEICAASSGSSRDCAGLWESDTRARLSDDDCGVCGGDGSSCRDCAGAKGDWPCANQ
jgi:hypothetical protein